MVEEDVHQPASIFTRLDTPPVVEVCSVLTSSCDAWPYPDSLVGMAEWDGHKDLGLTGGCLMAHKTVKNPTFTIDRDRQSILDSLQVPEELKTVPGSPVRPGDQRFHASAFPEQAFFRDPIYEMYDAYLARRMRDKSSAMVHSEAAKKVHGAELEELRKILWTYIRRPASKRRDPSPDLTEAFKSKVKEMGFDMIGITSFDRKYVYKEFRRRAKYKNLVILCIEQPWKGAQAAPGIEAYMSNFTASLPAYRMGIQFADWVRSKGYPVQFVVASQGGVQLSMAPVIPYAVASGLGQLGANGQLLTPLFGSRVRMVAFSTDAPLTHDRPIDYGINRLCEKCQVCVRRCPGRALPNVKVWWKGVLKNKTIADRCSPMMARYQGCSICIKVCPVQRYGLKAVLDHYSATNGKILGKGTDELEEYTLDDKGYFGSGKMPKFTVEEGSKGMLAMGKKLGIKEGIRRRRLGHIPGVVAEDVVPGMDRVDL